ncbi:MAG: hypothetical protein ACK58T_26645, partial [Phycisphaerae bacterium]
MANPARKSIWRDCAADVLAAGMKRSEPLPLDAAAARGYKLLPHRHSPRAARGRPTDSRGLESTMKKK